MWALSRTPAPLPSSMSTPLRLIALSSTGNPVATKALGSSTATPLPMSYTTLPMSSRTFRPVPTITYRYAPSAMLATPPCPLPRMHVLNAVSFLLCPLATTSTPSPITQATKSPIAGTATLPTTPTILKLPIGQTVTMRVTASISTCTIPVRCTPSSSCPVSTPMYYRSTPFS